MRRASLRLFARPGLLAVAVALATALGGMPVWAGAAMMGGIAAVRHDLDGVDRKPAPRVTDDRDALG